MATIDAKTGQIITPEAGGTGGTRTLSDLNGGNGGPAQTPYSIFAGNLTSMLRSAQSAGAGANAALGGQKDALARGQAFLGSSNPSNPLAFLYNMETPSGSTASQAQIEDIFKPGITSIETQQQNNQANLKTINDTANTQISAYESMKPNWTLAPQPNENGEWYYYNTNVGPGQPPQQYPAGKIPPGTGGSSGGSPGSADSVHTLSGSHNPYGIKMTPGTEGTYADLGAIPGPAATDGGNFWSFPDDTSGEKAARRLLTSNTYANDSVDQALRQWSNYTGTGQYPGYNGDILKGTGIDPNATIKSLSANQVDVVLAAMKKAEHVGAATAGQPGNLMEKAVAQVIGGSIGFDDQFNSLNGMYGGKLTKTQFLDAIHKVKPDFNVNQSNAVAAGQGSNTEIAAKTGALVDKTNQVLDLLPEKFKKLTSLQKQGGDAAGTAGDSLVNSSGFGKAESDDYYRTLADARASAQQVLTTAASLGVVTGGQTADSLLPQHMSESGLKTAIATIKDLEEKTKAALAKLANAGGPAAAAPVAGVTPSGIKYTVTSQ